MTEGKLSREAVARLEIGRTKVTRSLAMVISCVFLLTIFSVPLIQGWLDHKHDRTLQHYLGGGFGIRETSGLFNGVNSRNQAVLRSIDALEANLEEESFLRTIFLPPLQYFYLRYLGQGNEKVVPGKEQWLFYRPGLDALSGPPFLHPHQQFFRTEGHEIWEKPVQPDPVAAIVDFHNQLQAKGTKLLVVPIPIKPSIHPEKVSSRVVAGGLANRSWIEFTEKLRQNGVLVFNSRPVLQRYAKENGAAFLERDTHWLPGAMARVAEELAAYVVDKGLLVPGDEGYQIKEMNHQGNGDIAAMLNLPASQGKKLFNPQSIQLDQILSIQNEFWLPSRETELLLLGDSFTNIYSTPELGWGSGGGFAEHLSYRLQQPIDLLARNDNGAYVTREMLATEMGRGRDRISGKKLVIWQFAERELSLGNWKMVTLALAEPREVVGSEFLVLESPDTIEVEATISSISRSPKPGSVPYRDNLVTIHLVDLASEQELSGSQALVYGLGMRDNKLTGFARLRPNDRIKLTLSSWDQVEHKYGSYRRSSLDDEMLEFELPNWGTMKNETNR